MKTIIGLIAIAFGVFLEVLWLGVCFGTVIIGILLLIFAPRILFFPFNFFLLVGLTIMSNKPYVRSTHYRYTNHSGEQNSYARATNNLSRYYEILESNQSDSFDIVKANYRRLIKQYHYDSIASKNLPEDMVIFAQEKTQSLNEAYAAIKAARE
jgi:hypothetical protein